MASSLLDLWNSLSPCVVPSLLSADFSFLKQEVDSVSSAHGLHIDIMDGKFVPNLSFGPMLVKTLRPLTALPFDCHLMVENPEKWIEPFAKAGADILTIHAEATPHLNRILHQIKDHGCKAGIALNPSTPLTCIEEVLDEVDLILLMSVNPGFGGQTWIPSSLAKAKRLFTLRAERRFLIEMDGGIALEHLKSLREAGVDIFVAGASIFSASNRAEKIARFKDVLGSV